MTSLRNNIFTKSAFTKHQYTVSLAISKSFFFLLSLIFLLQLSPTFPQYEQTGNFHLSRCVSMKSSAYEFLSTSQRLHKLRALTFKTMLHKSNQGRNFRFVNFPKSLEGPTPKCDCIKHSNRWTYRCSLISEKWNRDDVIRERTHGRGEAENEQTFKCKCQHKS